MRRGFEDKDSAMASGGAEDGRRDIKRLRESGTGRCRSVAWVCAKDEEEQGKESTIFEIDSRSRFFLEFASASCRRSH
jgi:hypothetical protein